MRDMARPRLATLLALQLLLLLDGKTRTAAHSVVAPSPPGAVQSQCHLEHCPDDAFPVYWWVWGQNNSNLYVPCRQVRRSGVSFPLSVNRAAAG
jgi:hypothetical protein